MRDIFEFFSVAMPWIAMGLLLAIFFIRETRRKKDNDRNEDYASEGMSIGLCFGTAMSTALHVNIVLGMMAGMVLGYIIGSKKEKTRED